MNVTIREFRPDDITAALTVWNEVVEDGIAFPQTEILTEDSGMEFFYESILYRRGCRYLGKQNLRALYSASE